MSAVNAAEKETKINNIFNTDATMEMIKILLTDSITMLIPIIVKELLPTLTELTKSLVPTIINELSPVSLQASKEAINAHTDQILHEKSDERKETANAKKAFDVFRNRNVTFINNKLDEREELLYRKQRYTNYLQIYSDCMAEEPIYILRKFRKDHFHVKSQAELNHINTSEQQRFPLCLITFYTFRVFILATF